MIALLWGCATPTDTATTVGLPEITAPEVEPGWSPAEVGAILEERLAALPDPALPVAVYLELMSAGDDACPGDPYQILDTWLYGCDADTGYAYAGISVYLEEQTTLSGMDVMITGMKGDFWIDTPAGDTFELGGHAFTGTMEGGWLGRLEGSLTWTAGEPWLAEGFSGVYFIVSMTDRYLLLDGALTVEGTHFGMDELLLDASCGWAPSGRLRLRDDSGGWYTLALPGCSPCGMLSFEGIDQGELCLDLSAMTDALVGR
jgi:hypothetical protein